MRVLGFVLLVNVVGSVPAVVGGPDSAWFQALEKPWLYPPPFVFGVVWTILFTLMGIALWLVWRSDADARRVALGLFALQMVFNVAWTPAFFTFQSPTVALGIIVALWMLVVATILAFDRVDRRAAALLIPYIAWVTFAIVLNAEFVRLN